MKILTLMLLLFIGYNQSYAQEDNPSETNNVDLGASSMSLAVADINASFEFYKKLGFKQLEGAGSVDQKWMILINGSTKIGLFQDMFPKNTLTFNPSDGRTIDKLLKQQGITYLFATGLDQATGPCTFTFLDPDGNPILVDQH